jgi:membrane-associated protease RseP (regulator of RpoE activity)
VSVVAPPTAADGSPGGGGGLGGPGGGSDAGGPTAGGPALPGQKSSRQAFAELGIGAVVVTALAFAAGLQDLLLFVVCMVVIVMVHEAGHLLAAKRGGMKVTEYFLGFGPRLWSFRRGETEYGIKALPLGGYVKIPGMTNLEEVDPEDEPRTYRQQPFHARLLVAVAGSAMHFLMAFLLLWGLLVFVGVPSTSVVDVQQLNAVGGRPGPAQVAGLRAGDVLVSVDGRVVGADPTVLSRVVQANPGRPLTVVVEREGHRQDLTVVPANGRTEREKGVVAPSGTKPFGVVGVTFGAPTVQRSPLPAVGATVVDLGRYSWTAATGVVRLFSPASLTSQVHQVASAQAADQAAANGTRASSIYGVGQVAVDALRAGVGSFLALLITINLFFGIFNLFPMLPLDGGHVAIAVYEKIRTRRRRTLYHADVAKLLPFTWAFMAVLGVIVVSALLNDILHPVANPFG